MQKRVAPTEDAFRELKHVRRIKWLSVEPMFEPVEFTDLSLFNWIVVGALSATKQHPASFAPPWEWVVRLWTQAKEAGCGVYLKSNLLGVTNPQFPGMKLSKEGPRFRNVPALAPPPAPADEPTLEPDDVDELPAFLKLRRAAE
jgi:protein gp37